MIRTDYLGSAGGGGGSSPILAIATCQTRTQASYSAAAQGVAAMTSNLDLVITAPTGTTKVKLDWAVMGEVADNTIGASCFVVYKSVSGGAFSILAEAWNGADYWSVITRAVKDVDDVATPSTTLVSVIDNNPNIGSEVTYRLYQVNIRNDAGASTFYLNRTSTNSGAAFYAAGSSTGEAKCI